jgi:3-hydroxyacyl-CoA dehydrogenase/enoyl-CoA hydratase/3-hydroxybutyryl-CoA epimerase
VARADVIIEAIFEDLDAKRSLFAKLEAVAKPEAILATNTSSLKLGDIATALKDPSRLVGIHFFNPVPQMMLVEVVMSEKTRPALVQQAAAFVRRIDKLPLPVADSPGFLVNRVLGPYMQNAFRLLDEGHKPETIDAAMERFGMPMGPITLADTVGLDICLAAGKALAKKGTMEAEYSRAPRQTAPQAPSRSARANSLYQPTYTASILAAWASAGSTTSIPASCRGRHTPSQPSTRMRR